MKPRQGSAASFLLAGYAAEDRAAAREEAEAKRALVAAREAWGFFQRAQRDEVRAWTVRRRVGSGEGDLQIRVAHVVGDVERACKRAERAARGAARAARAKDARGALRCRGEAERAAGEAETARRRAQAMERNG